jgi:hypothetical protein
MAVMSLHASDSENEKDDRGLLIIPVPSRLEGLLMNSEYSDKIAA